MKKTILTIASFVLSVSVWAQQPGLNIQHLSGGTHMIRVSSGQKYLLMPVEEKAPSATIKVIENNISPMSINVPLAQDKVDYYVPFQLDKYDANNLVLEVSTRNPRNQNTEAKPIRWDDFKLSNQFDTTNRETYRLAYHHSPKYGWMNDPNGMVYKDGEWHLFFQYNPYASIWGNMSWGHSVSHDLIHWEQLDTVLEGDALGSIFSGSCVVDKNNTAGFGKDAIIAMYTSAGSTQKQSLAYSLDNGRTFTKYAGNPVLTAEIADFRDPNMFWNEQIGKWNLIMSAGQEMRIYSSPNLKDWTEESRFGKEYGSHGGVWECPDLFPVTVEGTDRTLWLLICNMNPGGPFGGSAVQYFVGDFDGHEFKCISKPTVSKWMDWGKDHYATVSFSNAPNNRHTVMTWMSNWEYANQTPTQQFRSSNGIAREIGLFKADDGHNYISTKPSPEYDNMRGKATALNLANNKTAKDVLTPYNDVAEMVLEFTPSGKNTQFGIELSNDKGEKVVMTYDMAAKSFSMDRNQSGKVDFSKTFPAVTTAPLLKSSKKYTLRLFLDRSSIEAFDGDGHFVMTNLVFPTTPYQHIRVFSANGSVKVNKATVYDIKL